MQLLKVATAFEEEAAKVERDGTFEEGYLDGWASVSGTAPLPDSPTQPLPSEPRTYDKGFLYGRGDTLGRFQSG
jgi:hypothetical protein